MKEHTSNRAFLINLFGLEWVIKRDERLVKKISKKLKLEI